MKVIIDLYGGDNSPIELAEGVKTALDKRSDLEVVLPVLESDMSAFEALLGGCGSRYSLIPAQSFVTNNTNPMDAVHDSASTLIKAFGEYKASDACGLLSVGSTGAVLMSALFILGVRQGVKKPALSALLPRRDGKRVCLLDCGANLSATPKELLIFAELGSEYMRTQRGIESPAVYLMNVGVEDKKGTEITRAAQDLLRESDLNYKGFCEPYGLFDCDVCVCDGFVGNMLLKNSESIGLNMIARLGALKETFKDGEEKDALCEFIDREYANFAYNDLGCSTILGVNKPVYKAHGAANAHTISSCIDQMLGL